MKKTIGELIADLQYYQSEHGGFSEYIPATVEKLKKMGYKGPWSFANDERRLGDYTEMLAKEI